jgi:hypothetical protein
VGFLARAQKAVRSLTAEFSFVVGSNEAIYLQG